MSSLNWSKFAQVTGAATDNWERLCRALIRRNFAHAGTFAALKNQPGVEFHLRLLRDCSLGKAGTWHGWQAKWFELRQDGRMRTNQRENIEKSLRTTKERLPDLTHWYLWTPQTLASEDQKWFRELVSSYELNLWTDDDVCDLLVGEAAILRETYFGELVYDEQRLRLLHDCATAPIRDKWIPKLHVSVDVEEHFSRTLLRPGSLASEQKLLKELHRSVNALRSPHNGIDTDQKSTLQTLANEMHALQVNLEATISACDKGHFSVVADAVTECADSRQSADAFYRLSRKLRAKSLPVSLVLSQALIVRQQAFDAMHDISRLLRTNFVAILGGKGTGKTFLSAQLTKPTETNPAGVLLLANKLGRKGTIDDLVRHLPKAGTNHFDELLEAVNAAGERSGIRIPVLIDGLNESDDPREWKGLLASVLPILERLDHVVLAVTLRGYVSEQCLPDDAEKIDLSGFENCIEHARDVYFDYYHISVDHVRIPSLRFASPLFLRFFCEATNPTRKKVVKVESVPTTVNAVFQIYRKTTAQRIADRIGWRAEDVVSAVRKLALEIWDTNRRMLPFDRMRELLREEPGKWDGSLTQALEQEGIVFRDQTWEKKEEAGITFDGFAGFCIADAIITGKDETELLAFCQAEDVQQKFSGDYQVSHPFSRDILSALAALIPASYCGVHAWTQMRDDARNVCLIEAANGDRQFLDKGTLSELQDLARRENSLYVRLHETAIESKHPLNAEFLDQTLLAMDLADRDLVWTEWLRRNGQALISQNTVRLRRFRLSEEISSDRARLLLLWNKWLLASTVYELRDSATEIIVHVGKQHPSLVLDECLRSLSLNDQSIGARLFTSVYGVCLASQTLPLEFVLCLGEFLKKLASEFKKDPCSPCFSHWEVREAIRDTVGFAVKFSLALPVELRDAYTSAGHRFSVPFSDLPDVVCEHAVGDNRIGMDFENYTVGRLFRDRRNYDYSHAAYSDSVTRIRQHAWWLGLRRSEFSAIDNEIGRMRYDRYDKRPDVERYAKKYGWIAFYNEVGRLDANGSLLPGDRDSLGVPGPEIDPSFPQKPPPLPLEIPTWSQLGSDDGDEKWMGSQAVPLPDDLWQTDSLHKQCGPWLLAHGWLNSRCNETHREIFGFIRTCLVPTGLVPSFVRAIESREYLGNYYLPDEPYDYCMYAAETPWSDRFESPDDWEYDSRYSDTVLSPEGVSIPLEILTHRYQFEGKRTSSVVASGYSMPSRDFSREFGLTGLLSHLFQRDPSKQLASLTFSAPNGFSDGNLCYIRQDLVRQYASSNSCGLVQIAWGERNILRDSHHDRERPEGLQQIYATYGNIWRSVRVVSDL
jgi:hypothetical protein